MNIMMRIMVAFVGLNGALATILAATASHSAAMANNPYLNSVFSKANSMHFYHLLALLMVAAFYQLTKCKLWLASAAFFALGIILFSGSLYLFAFSGAKIAGFLTPLGGVSFIFGWGMLVVAAISSHKQQVVK